MQEIKSPIPNSRAYSWHGCSIIIDRESGKWHMSISHPRRLPTWNEIRDARYLLLPADITMAMILPPPQQYVNLHPFCFHLHEIQTEGMAEVGNAGPGAQEGGS